MICQCLRQHAESRPSEPFLADETETLSFRQVHQRAAALGAALHREHAIGEGSTVYLHGADSVFLATLLIATQFAGARVCVLNRMSGPAELARLAELLPDGLLIADSAAETGWPHRVLRFQDLADSAEILPENPAESGKSGILVLTSGTTGPPKAVLYHWDRLFAQIRPESPAADRRWALIYPLNHFAGLQVFLHSLHNGDFLAVPGSRRFPDVHSCLTRQRIDSVSATPTFWRMFAGRLSAEEAQRLKITQITMGGEPATAGILDRLHALFPDARITHVYATTELGSCFAVNDGRPGFPARYLDADGHVAITIREGELHVRSSVGMVGYADGMVASEKHSDWMATGDSVEVRGDRVYFLGRKQEIINVGGVKVYPPHVENVIRDVTGVRDVRVYGKANAITGYLVAADVELSGTTPGEAVLAEIRKACRSALDRFQQPRELHLVEELPRSNEKLMRRWAKP